MSSNIGLNIWFAGTFAGFSVNLLFFPLDTLKTRLQSPLYQQTYKSSTAIANRALYRGLYQGISAVILVAIPSSGVFFTTYEGLKYALGSSWIPQPAVHSISSSIAQLLNCAVVAPAEVLKQNAQVLMQDNRRKKKTSPTMEVMRLLRKHPAKLWRGYTALVVRDLPFTALQFPAFEYLKRILINWRSTQKDGESFKEVFEHAKISAASASIAGSAAAWITTPFDVVKTRVMLEVGAKHQNEHPVGVLAPTQGRDAARRSGLQIFVEVFQNEGMRGLFRGGGIRTMWTFIGNGLYMGSYEGARFYLEHRRKATEED
ncbi:hypothetical protein LTR84_008340 [Exophiala bonariae]|uniref:Mitochondrial thiamine pyrophosphate carrier 1 n=1 Tax=Exophiala bonariae TaxID=1690606 RepID=A0AAV9MY50_9EURO|nr:hypothetical protein LTR84_008340 [Exophiala bonariae]